MDPCGHPTTRHFCLCHCAMCNASAAESARIAEERHAARDPAIEVHEVAYHRNGIAGEGFHAVRFTDRESGEPLVGIVFDAPMATAVLNVFKLFQGNITFGENSYRGDVYDAQLRAAIARSEVAA